MGLFSRAANTWNDQILVEAKRIFGLPHDATEQEVHEAMRRSQTAAEMTAGTGPAIAPEKPETSAAPDESLQMPDAAATPPETPEAEAETPDTTAGQADDNRVETLTQEVDTLRATVDTLQTEVDTLRQQMAAILTRLKVIEEMPAATHTGGATEIAAKNSGTPVWEQFKKQYGL